MSGSEEGDGGLSVGLRMIGHEGERGVDMSQAWARSEAFLDRRTFLGAAAMGFCGASLAAPIAVAGQRDDPRPCSPDAWKKGPVVLGKEGGPADRWVQNFTCPAEPLEDGRWRLWYSIAGPKVPFNVAVAEGVPGGPMERRVAVLSAGEPQDAPLAIGNLPEGWRPVQPVHLRPPRRAAPPLLLGAAGRACIATSPPRANDGRRFRVLDPLRPCLYHPPRPGGRRGGGGRGRAGALRGGRSPARCRASRPPRPA